MMFCDLSRRCKLNAIEQIITCGLNVALGYWAHTAAERSDASTTFSEKLLSRPSRAEIERPLKMQKEKLFPSIAFLSGT